MNKQIIKENQLKREEFVKSQEVKIINVVDVILTEQTHKNARVTFKKEVERIENKNITVLNNPIIVKQEKNDKYSLVSGYRGYSIAKSLNHMQIPVVIITESRKEFIRNVGFKSAIEIDNNSDSVEFDKIVIPKCFLETTPRKEKVDACIEYYKNNNKLDAPVVINNSGLLIDGYIRYIVARIMELKVVPVVVSR